MRVRGPKGAFNVEMQRDRKQDRTIHCKYEPREPGDYVVEVRYVYKYSTINWNIDFMIQKLGSAIAWAQFLIQCQSRTFPKRQPLIGQYALIDQSEAVFLKRPRLALDEKLGSDPVGILSMLKGVST